MEFLEAVCLLRGRYYGIFHGTAAFFLGNGSAVLYSGVCDDHIRHSSEIDIRRSGVGLGIPGMYHAVDRRRAVFLYRNPGAVPCQNIYGSEETPNIFGAGEDITTIYRILTEL